MRSLSVLRARLVLFVLLAVATVGGVATDRAAAVIPSVDTRTSSAYVSPTFGYEIDLPSGWRRSSVLSTTITANPIFLGHDLFTRRSDSEEAALVKEHQWMGPAWQWTVIVMVHSNPAGLTPMEWASDQLRAGFRVGQRIEQFSFAGRSAVRVTGGARLDVAYYVADRGRMYLVGYLKHDSITVPGVSEAGLAAIAGSFRFQP